MRISNWGGNPKLEHATIFHDAQKELEGKHCIRGNGRSYGDASLYPVMRSMLKNKNQLSIKNSILTVSSGYTLLEVMNFCQLNDCLFPVIPGTAHVTIGGMVAADVHGKNHKVNGTIGCWVQSIALRMADNTTIQCSLTENKELFKATIGGMGLTGIIDTVAIQLQSKKGNCLSSTVEQLKELEKALVRLDTCSSDYQTVWCDMLNSPQFLLIENDWIQNDTFNEKEITRGKLSIPKLPVGILVQPLMKLYNRYFSWKQKKQNNILPKEAFFPLDSINNWNRLYGPKGFYQYQFIVPKESGLKAIGDLFQKIRTSKFPVYLAVLKVHKENQSPGMLSFPMEGYSVALDFPNRKGIIAFLNELDEVLLQFNGRVYLAKDAVLKPENFNKMYSNHAAFKEVVTTFSGETFTSLLSERLNLTK